MTINYDFIKAIQPIGCEPRVYGQYINNRKQRMRGGYKKKMNKEVLIATYSCPKCGGKGFITDEQRGIIVQCSLCGGVGRVMKGTTGTIKEQLNEIVTQIYRRYVK